MNRFPWVFSVLWLAVLSVMIWAGFWQLRRADEKTAINQRLSEKQFYTPQTNTQWKQLKAFKQVRVFGHYLDTHFILDNQIMDGQIGHFIFTAFKTNNNQIVLVNRGWTDASNQSFDVDDKVEELLAAVADWPRPGFQLGEQDVQKRATQHLTYMPQEPIHQLLKDRHCRQSNTEECIILPQVLKLNPDMDSGFKRNWQLPRMTVEKHRAYAAQWFTMSVVLCLVYIIFLRKSYFSTSKD